MFAKIVAYNDSLFSISFISFRNIHVVFFAIDKIVYWTIIQS